MAEAARKHYGDAVSGILVQPRGLDEAPLPGFESFPAGHPVPDEVSVAAAEAALALAGSLASSDRLLLLLSGGGSALMCLPPPGVSLADKQALTRGLLARGATIAEINCVRKHLSRIKGGRLAAACAAPVTTLAISDVPGDDPALIASGPALPDPTTLEQARDLLARQAIETPPSITAALGDPSNETPVALPGCAVDRTVIVARAATALRAAAGRCRSLGIEPVLLGDDLQGEARALGTAHARAARELAADGAPRCLLSGGETTTRLAPNPGRGGRNTEYALALARGLEGDPRIWALAADTDGIDGHGGHAGALVDPGTLHCAGLDAEDYLRRSDSATLFETANGLLVTGPTGTNVNDFRAILVNGPR